MDKEFEQGQIKKLQGHNSSLNNEHKITLLPSDNNLQHDTEHRKVEQQKKYTFNVWA